MHDRETYDKVQVRRRGFSQTNALKVHRRVAARIATTKIMPACRAAIPQQHNTHGDVSMTETTTALLEQRLANLEEVLTLCQAAIGGQTEALRTQTEMLTALWRELTKEPGPSPALAAIERLSHLMTERLDRIAAAVDAVVQQQTVLGE